ncbi:MAG: hypothetical protein KA169_13880 [Burkholderiaceae bacterium]|nr:hypothetical protein [Burkholderiaceae bacterium]
MSDDAGRCVDANPALCAWLGYQRIEMVGMPICDLMVPVPAPGRTGRRIGAGRQLASRVCLRSFGGQWLAADCTASEHVQPGLHLSILREAPRDACVTTEGEGIERQLRRLALAQLARVDEIRAELARNLHDELGQTLGALSLEVEMLQGQHPEQARRMRHLIDEGMASVRDMSRALRPATLDLGLLPALRALIEQSNARSKVAVLGELIEPLLPLPEALALCLFRIAQEAIGNSLRHARASRIVVRLASNSEAFELEVQDDGCGFELAGEAANSGLGILGMRERAGHAGAQFTLDSAPGRGTRVGVRLGWRASESAR